MSSSDSEHSSPKPSKRRRVVISDSDSSDGSSIKTHRRRRVYRVTSDSETSEEDSDVPKPVIRRNNYRVVSEDDTSYESSDTEADGSNDLVISDSESSASNSDWRSGEDSPMEEEEEGGGGRRAKLPKGSKKSKSKVVKEEGEAAAAPVDSDSSDGQAEKCPICLLSFKKQEIANPESCDHSFCLDCLLEWSKNINTCPVDRQTFAIILVRKKLGGKVVRQLPVAVRPPVEEQIQEDATYCEICQECDREDRMLLCDGCDLGYHLECLTPPMTEVPMDEWFCPECAQNSQNDAEVVDIDLDELPDLMEEARRLGESYGRTRTGRDRESSLGPRVIPRTRQTERVRANIRADRDRNRAVMLSRDSREQEIGSGVVYLDPDQPSTSSSGMDTVVLRTAASLRTSEAVRRRRINAGAVTPRSSATGKSKAKLKRKRKTKRRTRRSTTSGGNSRAQGGETRVREVRITEINDDGEEEEFVTYVKVKSSDSKAQRSGRKYKKRSKNTRKKGARKRRARTVRSQAAKVATVKKRLAITLGMQKPNRSVPLLVPTVKTRQNVSERAVLSSSRYHAGISQVSLFGNSHDLNYSPTGFLSHPEVCNIVEESHFWPGRSDSESESCLYGGSNGNNSLLVSSRPRNATSSTRRHASLKAISNPLISRDVETSGSPPPEGSDLNAADFISGILNSQEFWHSKNKNKVTLKADGTFLILKNNNNNNENDNNVNKHSVNNNESPVKEKKNIIITNNEEENNTPTNETRLDLNNVSQNDVVQNPMYNSPRGGGNRGNFRGGNNYNCENNRHSYGGGQYGGGRDSYGGGGGGGGRHSYGGPGGPRDGYNSDRRDFGPPNNYNQGFEARAPHPGFGTNQQFRNRNPQQNFRNERPPRFPPPLMNDRPQHQHGFPHPDNSGDRPQPFSHPNSFQRFRPSLLPPLISSGPRVPLHSNLNQPFQDESHQSFHQHDDVREQLAFSQPGGLNEPGNSRAQIPDEEECDLYSDIEPPLDKNTGDDSTVNEDPEGGAGAVLLPPPPEPPSGLLDFEESKSDRDCNDSDQELVIDDTPKEDNREGRNDDKYDPFAADSDSNEGHGSATIPSQSFAPVNFDNQTCTVSKPPVRLTAYDDDDDDDSQADCPNFSIYSSQTMDVARNSEQELSQQIGPLEPPPLPPDMPDDDDIIVGDIQACDLADIPEPSDPYVESLQKERQTLSKIPPKKISNDSRGKITFKIGNKLRLSNKLSNLYDEMDENIENSIQQEKEVEDNDKKEEIKKSEDKKDAEPEDNKSDEDEEEEKLEELEKELKEKEQKLREMEQLEEMEKLNVEAEAQEPKEETEDLSSTKIEDTDKRDDRDCTTEKNQNMSTIDLTEKSSDTIISIADTVQSSPKNPETEEKEDDVNSSHKDEELNGEKRGTGWKRVESEEEKVVDKDVLYDKIDEEYISRKELNDDDEDEEEEDKSKKSTKTSSTNDETPREDNEEEENIEEASEKLDFIPEVENFPLEKDPSEIFESGVINPQNWESDGGYTPCKDELPVSKIQKDTSRGSLSPFESGLEPITPTKDKSNDDLDGCRTPAGYAGLGTEAISETDEPMSFEEELTQLNLRKEKEMEDGEIMDDGRLSRKTSEKRSSKENEEESKRKKKKEKKEKGKESDKNKENIASQNQVAWKKISKNTKERQYRDKDRRSKSKEKERDKDRDKENHKDSKDKEKDRDRDKDKDNNKSKSKKGGKEVARKKEKRKELERYDVRKIVADKPSRPRKDEYGRDIRDESRSRSRSRSLSRRRSLSRDRRSRSYSRNRSRSRSRSRLRRSWSRDRGSYTKGGRSLSRRRSLSRSRRKVSRRRSASRKRSISRKRSLSKRRSRSPSRKRRSLSPRRRSRGRSLSKNRRSRSRSREKKKEKPKKQHKSRSRSRNRKRSRSKTPPKRVSSRSRDKKHERKRKQHASRSRERSRERSRSREQREQRNKNWEPVNEKAALDRERHASSRDRRSWSAQWTPSWSRSRSRTPSPARHEEVASHGGWSPPAVLDNVAVPPKNLTVILTNKEAIKKKKKEKKKDPKKLKELDKRKKNKRNRTPPPSKEVFASGDNILVSVCFNKENESNPAELPDAPEAPPLVTPAAKRSRRRETTQQNIEPVVKRSKKEKLKEKRAPKSPKNKKEKKKKSKAAEIAATKKPVAVIDLDQSPFREQTPSPRDVIVLSDDEDHKETQEIATPEQHVSPRASPQHEQFVSQGPKTPPEPQIKFSINKQQSNLRTSMINPLHEEEEEEIDERADEELEMRAQEELELRLKIGPNTPPEPPTSPPTSPDAYDPFDPTKSRSPTPAPSQEATPADERDRNQCNSPRNHDADENTSSCVQNSEVDKQGNQEQQNQGNDKQTDKPKIISMVTIKRASPKRESPTNVGDSVQTEPTQPSNDSPNKNQQGLMQQGQQSQGSGFTNINPVLATVTAAVQRSGTLFNTSTPISGQRNLIQPNRISPINQNKQQRSIERPHLPNLFANPGKATPSRGAKSSSSNQSKNVSTLGQNGSDTGMETTNDTLDMSSPYSPGSSLSDGIFDPPSPGAHSPQQLMPPQNTSKNTPSKATGGGKAADKKDAFDVLFGTSPAVKNIGKNRARKIPDKDKRKKSTNPKVGVRMDENQLQILDDLPSSAVEMQVKDKFLKKLNRQERVVEEVKLVLKPHYTKKHVTKEEYKDIMRKAVPKICHNKTGEINPKKIGQLVEAYVKKCRINKKKGSGGGINAAKGPKAAKNLWS